MNQMKLAQEVHRMQIAADSAKQMDEIRKRQAEQQAKAQNVKNSEPKKGE